MQITLFGVIWTIILIFCFCSSDYRRMISAVLFSLLFQCNNAIYINDTGIGVQSYTIFISWLYLFLIRNSRKKKIGNGLIVGFSLLILSVFLSIVYNNLFDLTNLIGFFMIFVYALYFFSIMKKNIMVDKAWIESIEDKIIVVSLIVGALQMLCKMGVTILEPVLVQLVYNDTLNMNVIFNYKSNVAFYSTYMEPSYCGAFLVGMLALVLFRKENSKKNITLVFLIILAILLTLSTTAYLGMIIVLAMMLFVKGKKKIYKNILPLLTFGGILFSIFNMDILEKVIFKKMLTGSYSVRHRWNLKALEKFQESPIFGVGYSSLRGSSIISDILGELGIVGAISYSIIFLYLIVWIIRKGADIDYIGKIAGIISIMICQMLSCPDLNFAPFWMFIYFFALAANTKQNTDLSNTST